MDKDTPLDKKEEIKVVANPILAFIKSSPSALDDKMIIDEVKKALQHLKVSVLGIVALSDMSVINYMEVVLNDYLKKKKIFAFILTNFNELQTHIQDSKNHSNWILASIKATVKRKNLSRPPEVICTTKVPRRVDSCIKREDPFSRSKGGCQESIHAWFC